MRARVRAAVVVSLLAVVLASCAVPHERAEVTVEKAAAGTAEVDAIFTRYRAVRNTAIELLDPQPLSTVETGAVLAIDTGSFEVSQRLASSQEADDGPVDVTEALSPRFTSYPIWFFAVVRDRDRKVNRVQVFERRSSVDPWLLVASPETVIDTALPELRRGAGGLAVTVDPADGVGVAMSAQKAADTYAKALADPESAAAKQVETDSFIRQMRASAEQNADLADVEYTQSWGADEVEHVLRTSDGGVLAFVNLLRQDSYEVDDGLTVSWPDGSPQQAFLSSGISSSGTLRYYHQILLYLPGGDDRPRALGQYGGVVSGDGS